MIHLYTVTRNPIIPEGLLGLRDARLMALPCGPVEAIVSEHEVPVAPDRRAALTHAGVVAAVAARTRVLPVRFGVAYHDVASLRTALRATADELLDALDQTDGLVEFVVRRIRPPRPRGSAASVHDRPGPPGAATAAAPGRAHLEDRLAEQRAERQAQSMATAELRALTSELDTHAAAVVEHVGHGGAERCFLVERSVIGRFTVAAVACLDGRDELVLAGPWPPYTFAVEALG